MTYYMTAYRPSDYGRWEECKATTLAGAKREASKEYADTWRDSELQIATGDAVTEERIVVASKPITGARWEDHQPKRGAPTKPADERADSHMHIRVTREQKAGWVKQAQREGKKLSVWVVERLG